MDTSSRNASNAKEYPSGSRDYNNGESSEGRSTKVDAITEIVFTVPDISELNDEKVASYYPIYIFLGLVLVLGLLCNFVVCYIYRCRSRRATSNFFVIFFAIADMVCCILGTAAELLNLIMPYTYKVKTLCQLTAFFKSFLVCQLPLTLICVAYDCYRKVCRPHEEFGVKKAGFYCGISICLSLLLSIPAFSTYGIKQVLTEHPEVVGTACAPDPAMQSWLNLLHYACMLLPFILSLAIMTIFYSLIAVSHCRQKQAEERGEKPSPLKREFPKKHTFVSKEDISSSSTSYYSESRRHPSQVSSMHSSSKPSIYNDSVRVPLKAGPAVTIKKTNSMQATTNPGNAPIIPLHVKNKRQALMFAIISIIFFILTLPFVVVSILNLATKAFETPLAYDTDLVFNLSIRSYILNYITKPVLYLIFNVNFRKEVKHLFSKMWALCLRSPPSEPSLPAQPPRTVTPQISAASRNLLKKHDQRAKVEMSPMLQRSSDIHQVSSSSSVQKPRERWRWNQAD